jgi:hypothetical protein
MSAILIKDAWGSAERHYVGIAGTIKPVYEIFTAENAEIGIRRAH